MAFIFSDHALQELARRDIPRAMAELVAQSPEQVVADPPSRSILQSRVTINGKQYLLRLVIELSGTDNVVVTGYRTSKVAKYWVKP